MKRFLALILSFVLLVSSVSLLGCGNKFTVTFDGNGGTQVAGDTASLEQEVSSADELVEPKFERAGYDFNGWDLVLSEITTDATVKAQWKKQSFTVTFNGGGGTQVKGDATGLTQMVTEASALVAPKFEKYGYSFNGWSVDLSTITESTTVMALWKANEYTISFDANGGAWDNGFDDDYTVAVTFDKKIADGEMPTATKQGYQFEKWTIVDSEISGDFSPTVEYKYAKDLTLKISWIPLGDYIITYNGVDGINNTSDLRYTFKKDDNSFNLATPEKTGYTFAGWTGEGIESATQTVTVTPSTMQRDLTYTANWTANTYTISFDANGGTWDSGFENSYQLSATYDSVVSGTFPTATKTNYRFDKWKIIEPSSLNGEIFNPQSNYTYTTDITLQIVWKDADAFDISYNGTENITNPSALKTGFKADDVEFNLVNPEKTGYTFAGWTGEDLESATQTVTVTPSTMQRNLTYTANWTANTYTISFDANGGTWDSGFNSSYQLSATYDSVVSGTFPTATLTGKKFGGWEVVASGVTAGTQFNTASNYTYAQNITLKIIWVNATSYTISYTGVESTTGLKTKFYENDAEFDLINPTKTGYEFAGWTGEGIESATQTVSVTPSTMQRDLTYTANWTANTYTISFNANGGIWDSTFTDSYKLDATYDSNVYSGAFPTAKLIGKKFVRWEVDGSGATFNITDKYTYAQDINLKIVWADATSYTITYGDSIKTPTTFYENTAPFNLEDDAKTGYTFNGWTGEGVSEPTKGIQINPATVLGNLTYTANWTAKQYTVTLKNDLGKKEDDGKQYTMTYDQSVGTLATPSAIEGYTFAGWKYGESTIFKGGSNGDVKWQIDEADGNIELTAVWRQNTYKVKFGFVYVDANKNNRQIEYTVKDAQNTAVNADSEYSATNGQLISQVVTNFTVTITNKDDDSDYAFSYWAYKVGDSYVNISNLTVTDELFANGELTLYAVCRYVWIGPY